MNFSQAFEQSVAEATRISNASLTSELRKQAVRKGWPAAVAMTLAVDVTKNQKVRMSKAAEDLEYGTPSRAPLPVVREFSEQVLGGAFINNIRNSLGKRGVMV